MVPIVFDEVEGVVEPSEQNGSPARARPRPAPADDREQLARTLREIEDQQRKRARLCAD
jgi:hypothetical protein